MNQNLSVHKNVTKEELDLLLCHLIQSEDVFRVAYDKLDMAHFDTEAEIGYKLIWARMKIFFKEHNTIPPEAYLRAEVTKAIAGDNTLNHPHIIKATQELLDLAYCFKDPIPQYAMDVLSSFLFQRVVAPKIKSLHDQGTFGEDAWDNIVAEKKSLSLERSADVTPFASGADMLLGVMPRDPTGVGFVDEMLGGGTRPGELFGFLAPSSGGKTTLSNQIAIEYARKKKHMLVFSYESPVDAEYLIPVYACATKIKRARWESIPVGTAVETIFTPQEMQELNIARESISKYLHFIDHSGLGNSRSGFNGVQEIDNKLTEYEKRTGCKVDAFVVDWFWPMVTRAYHNVKMGYGKSMDMRVYAQGCVDELRVVAQRHKAWCWINHQLKPDEAKKNRDMEFEDAAELKSFAWYLNGCLCMGRMDDEKVGSIKYSKARSVDNSVVHVQLEGEIARFGPVKNKVFDPRQGKHVDAAEINAIPGEKTKTQLAYEGKKVGAAIF